jgi:probable DNA metabolism protein
MNSLSYDGSFRGFLCCLAALLGPDLRFPGHWPIFNTDDEDSPLFGCSPIPTDHAAALRIERFISEGFSPDGLTTARRAFLSELPGREPLICGYLSLGFLHGNRTDELLTEPCVSGTLSMAKAVSTEAHRYLGLVRFDQLNDGLLYSSIEPRHFILPLIGNHFRARLSGRNWIIHDPARSKALLCRSGECRIVPMPAADRPGATPAERTCRVLWKKYFEAAAIPERVSPERQRQHLPLYCRKHLTEFDPADGSP